MNPQENDYHFSFFKPKTESARHNRNMVVQFVLIWAVAIFGFQILLKILEKPTPEPAYLLFETSWEKIQAGDMNVENLQQASQAALSVLGKVAIDPGHRAVLDNAVSWMAYGIADAAQKADLMAAVSHFEEVAAHTEDITSKEYVAEKEKLIPLLREIYDLHPNDVRAKIAPLEVHSGMMESFNDENRAVLEDLMGLYLVHNRSVLTDTKFLGFPFHYFYTAVFLLILFVGICWLYCVRTDMYNRRYGIED